MMDGAMSSSTSVLHTPRLEGQSLCKAERLQALNAPLGPYDRSYSRKRLREHSLERTDCEFLRRGAVTQRSVVSKSDRPLMFRSLSQNLPGLEHPLPDTDQHALCTSQPPPSPTLHVFRERHASGCWQPEHLKHTRTEATFQICRVMSRCPKSLKRSVNPGRCLVQTRLCPPTAAYQEAARRELLRYKQYCHPHVCGRHHAGGEAAVQGDPHTQVTADWSSPPALSLPSPSTGFLKSPLVCFLSWRAVDVFSQPITEEEDEREVSVLWETATPAGQITQNSSVQAAMFSCRH